MANWPPSPLSVFLHLHLLSSLFLSEYFAQTQDHIENGPQINWGKYGTRLEKRKKEITPNMGS